jgi:hypothetical protein
MTVGEILTIGSQPKAAMGFTGPVLVVTGNEDAIFCGGNCTATGGVAASIPAEAKMVFPNSTYFDAYIQPKTGHALNVHYNSTGAYNVMNTFLQKHGF